MILASILLLAAAAAVVVVPMVKMPALRCSSGPAPAPAVSFQAAIGDLAEVRRRLVATGTLADDQARAIDCLTLALVAGSDE